MKEKVRMTLVFLSALTLIFSFGALTATGQDKPLEGYHIGISAVGTEHTWDANCYNGMRERLKELGAKVTAFDAGRSDSKMKSDLETLISMEPDGLMVMLGTLSVVKPKIEKAREKGIKVVTADSLPGQVNVSTNNFIAESKLAIQMVKDLDKEGQVGIFYKPGAAIAELRYNVFKTVIDQFPNVEVVVREPYVLPGTIPDAYQKTRNWLKSHPELDAVWSLFDIPMIGAARAIEEAGMEDKVKCYGFDGDPKAISMIRDGGAFAATVAQQPTLIGETAADMMKKLLMGEDTPPMKFVDAMLVTKDNVEEAINTIPKYEELRS